jgi:hypothetical protein
VAQKKEEKDVAKKHKIRKALEREALNMCAASRGSTVSLSRNPPLRWPRGRMRVATTTTPGHGMTP